MDLTGKLLEEEIFCEIHAEWHGYMNYRKAMSFVIDHQEQEHWDPTDPTTFAGRDLHASVALAIEEEIGRDFDWSELELYSALRTPLDYFHGVDGFFSFKGVVVTLDVTKNPDKEEYKADLIMQYENFLKGNKYDFSEIAGRIATMLVTRVMGAYA